MSSVNFLSLDSLYHEIFASDGTVKACGRKKCSELIRVCQQFRPMDDKFYGNPETGFMDINAIHGLYKDAAAKYFILTER